ncbi:hypothetical protein [uncultured Fretibacterium sp.]|uniref:hypothetical protein n=1 Tax=uncultured Fretibacterium sp. TaxID=1678694 RepID=UPI002628AE16|nr:hypothetical protein [uncultured Fretibacterium sp.]
MTNVETWDRLREHRPLLLACEAIGWLHMAGKARIKFLQMHGGQHSGYEYEKWDESESPPFPWNDRLKWVQDEFPLDKNNAWPGELTEFIRKHTGRDHGLLGLLQAGHAMASGIEKNLPANASGYLGQDVTHLWMSSAFGTPVRNLLDNPPEALTEEGWKHLLGEIETLLRELEALGKPTMPHTADAPNSWRDWREKAVGPDGWLRRAFTSTLAETRLPNNDVTLFDQSYVAAALFKSAVAGAVLEGNAFPWSGNGLKQETRWRLLTVGIGVDHYEARAVKIGDWTGARLALGEFFTKVRRLVEVDLAAGSLLYRDGGVCVFSFPGERLNHKGDDLHIADWQSWLTEEIDGYARETNLETPPYCHISAPSRSLVGMTAEIQKARETMAVPLYRDWKIPGQGSSDGPACPVCLVRRSPSGTDRQRPCAPCRRRRTHRLDAWLKGEQGKLDSDSIWLSEVADTNDRVALVTLSLDIEPWLDGIRLDALRTQAIPEWRKFNPELSNFWERDENKRKREPNPIDQACPFDSLQEEITKRIEQFKKNGQFIKDDLLLCSLQEGYRREKDWPSFFSKIVEDRSSAPEWEALNDDGCAAWLAHQLFCKLASPGRIHRFWRQAEEFFRELLGEFRKLAAADPNCWRVRRLLLKPDQPSSTWKNRVPYNGRCDGNPIDLLFDEERKGFVTLFNMSRFLAPEQDKGALQNKEIVLKDDDNKNAGTLKVQSVENVSGALGVYHPVIPLELSPMRFRVLLPLEAASACVDRAAEAWRAQFARVWDRLPLRVGVVAFSRMMPFQAVIEAARNIESDLEGTNEPETWRVAGCETREGVAALRLESLDHPQELLQTVPITLPDGRDDVFYPYLAVEDKSPRFPRDFRHPNGQVFRHASDLQSGDGISVHPSRIAVLFMDDATKRFQSPLCRPLMEWLRMRELWQLVDRYAPSQTALRGAWSEVVERREAWQGADGAWLDGGEAAWLDLARAMFHERLGVRGACLEELVEAAGDGLLDWSLEWYISVLKKQVSGGKR